MSLRLTLRPGAAPAGVRIDAPAITPDVLGGLAPADAARVTVGAGRQAVPLGDLFAIDADAGAGSATDGATAGGAGDEPGRVTLEGDLGAFARLGEGMSRGHLHVRGPAGPRAGSRMRGGRLVIEGDAGPRAGEGMSGGLLVVGGAAGDRAGAPPDGAARGMDGGVLIVRGGAGALAGFRMRRGTLCIGGAVGPAAGTAMIAGTLVLLGRAGPDTGALMRRGTIVVLAPGAGGARFVPGATFAPAGAARAPWLLPWWEALGRAGLPIPGGLAAARFARHSGDLSEGGRGEILVLEEGA